MPEVFFLFFMVELQTLSSDTAIFAMEFKKPWRVAPAPWATSGTAARKPLDAGVHKLPVDVCDSKVSVPKHSHKDD